ncbi:MAG: aminotransferase class V-fold PLP-dependent enzyme, partial [Spirochaetales bacterium]|nr:aminotransferase class V-fold PLP-dependent enzyme [Candidatus Physcosoma equi]
RGLSHSLSYVLDNLSELKAHTERMTMFLLKGLESLEGIRIVGPSVGEKRTDVISITCQGKDIADLAAFLSDRGIETRVGLHCSPEAHRSLGTYPTGTLRFSPGPFTTVDEVVTTLEAVKEFLEA